MLVNQGVDGIEDWLKQAESVVTSAGKVKRAYDDARAPKAKPVVVPQPQFSIPPINLNRDLMLYIGAGVLALILWTRLTK